jgi:hypothetical protein
MRKESRFKKPREKRRTEDGAAFCIRILRMRRQRGGILRLGLDNGCQANDFSGRVEGENSWAT